MFTVTSYGLQFDMWNKMLFIFTAILLITIIASVIIFFKSKDRRVIVLEVIIVVLYFIFIAVYHCGYNFIEPKEVFVMDDFPIVVHQLEDKNYSEEFDGEYSKDVSIGRATASIRIYTDDDKDLLKDYFNCEEEATGQYDEIEGKNHLKYSKIITQRNVDILNLRDGYYYQEVAFINDNYYCEISIFSTEMDNSNLVEAIKSELELL